MPAFARRLLGAALLGVAQGSWVEVVEKAKAREAKLQAAIAEHCGDGKTSTSCLGSCAEMQQALQAAQKVKELETQSFVGKEQWLEVLNAIEHTTASGCFDVSEKMSDEPSSDMSVEEQRLLVSLSLGEEVGDSYFYEDEVGQERRLQDTWAGPRIARGYPWNDKTMKYAWDPSIGSNAKTAILSAMEEIREKSCVKFEEVAYDYSGGSYVKIMDSESGCWSGVGQGKIRLNLGVGCRSHGTALHEILHALGQTHEQCRADRDHFLDLRYHNVPDDKKHNFDIAANSYTGRGYDYMSIMHYGRFAFTKNAIAGDLFVGWTLNQLSSFGLDTDDSTLQPRNSMYNGKIGQRGPMSDGDAEQLNDMYQCHKVAVSSEGSPGLGIKWTLDSSSVSAIIEEDWFEVGTGKESMPVACNAGYAATSCTCFQDNGECRGAMVTEIGGSTCVASPTSATTKDLKAYGICLRLASPHYKVALMSDEDYSPQQACASNYRLMGCSCSSRGGERCYVAPSSDGSKCEAVGLDGKVQVQAHCIRSLAVTETKVVTGASASESHAVCTDMDLVGCHCKGPACKGARPMGLQKNECKALATSASENVEAVAICAKLADYGTTELPGVEYLTGGQVANAENVPAAGEPIQSMYCGTTGSWSSLVDKQGCANLKVQTRSTMDWKCSRSGCQNANLAPDQTQHAQLLVTSDGAARCPAGWVMVRIECKDDCKTFQVECRPPSPGSPWYLSGGRSYTPWFNGETGSAMGSCGQALAIGLECAKSSWLRDSSCKLVRLVCRRVALHADDSKASHSSFDMSFAEPRWTEFISSTGFSEAFSQFQFTEGKEDTFKNDDLLPLYRMKCSGSSCDDLRAEMPTKLGSLGTYVSLKGTPTIWTTRFEGEIEMRCPVGHYVANMKCSGSYCAEKELLCALPASGSNWFVSGGRYYSHCFTNEGQIPYADWLRDTLYETVGNERTCAGLQISQMPDSQSCGEDGVLIGLRCYGDNCDRLQLVCSGIDANVNETDGSMQEVEARKAELKEMGLYDDMSTWPSKPSNGQPSSKRWNGQETTDDTDGGGFLVSSAERQGLLTAMAALALLL